MLYLLVFTHLLVHDCIILFPFFLVFSSDDLVEYVLQVANCAPNTPLFYYHIPVWSHVTCKKRQLGYVFTYTLNNTQPVPGVQIVERGRKIHEGKINVFPVYNLTRSPLNWLFSLISNLALTLNKSHNWTALDYQLLTQL